MKTRVKGRKRKRATEAIVPHVDEESASDEETNVILEDNATAYSSLFSFCKQRGDPLQTLMLKEREKSVAQGAPTRKTKEKNLKLTQRTLAKVQKMKLLELRKSTLVLVRQ